MLEQFVGECLKNPIMPRAIVMKKRNGHVLIEKKSAQTDLSG